MSRPMMPVASIPPFALCVNGCCRFCATKFPHKLGKLQRADIAQFARDVSLQFFEQQQINLNALDQRDLITALINGYLASVGGNASAATVMRPELVVTEAPKPVTTPAAPNAGVTATPMPEMRVMAASSIDQAKLRLQPLLMERIHTSAAAKMDRTQLNRDVTELVTELLNETRI